MELVWWYGLLLTFPVSLQKIQYMRRFATADE